MRKDDSFWFSGTSTREKKDRFLRSALLGHTQHCCEKPGRKEFRKAKPENDLRLQLRKDPVEQDQIPIRWPLKTAQLPHKSICGDELIEIRLTNARLNRLVPGRKIQIYGHFPG